MVDRLQPTRIALDPQASPALRRLVNHARADLPDTASLSRLATRLDTAIAANIPGPEITTTSGVSGSLAVKLLGAVLIAGAAAGGATYLVRGSDHTTATSMPSVSAATSMPGVSAATSMPGVSAATSMPGVSAATSPNPVATEQRVVNPSIQPATEPTAASSAATPPPAPEASTVHRRPVTRDVNATEATLLDAARAKLRTDPRRAVELTREHARRFPNGVLIQEREVIAIEALRRLGQDDAAKKRGEDFNQQYPNSAHQSKIGQTLKGN